MKIEEIEAMGFISENNAFKPNCYYHPDFDSDTFKIVPNDTLTDVLLKIWNNGYAKGVEYGKASKANEIKNALNL